jgi:hypothetical protein
MVSKDNKYHFDVVWGVWQRNGEQGLQHVSRGIIGGAYQHIIDNPTICSDRGFIDTLQKERGVAPEPGLND